MTDLSPPKGLGAPSKDRDFVVTSGAIVGTCVVVCCVLVVISSLLRSLGIRVGRLDLDYENSVPTLWSAFQLALLAAICAARTAVATRNSEAWKHWAFMTLCVVFLTLDEALAVHELLIEPIRNSLNTSGLLHLAWIIPYSLLVVVVVALLLPWVLQLPPPTRNGLLLGGALFVLGAMGMEAIGGSIAEVDGTKTFEYSAVMTIEESLELAGVVVAIRAVLGDLVNGRQLTFRVVT